MFHLPESQLLCFSCFCNLNKFPSVFCGNLIGLSNAELHFLVGGSAIIKWFSFWMTEIADTNLQINVNFKHFRKRYFQLLYLLLKSKISYSISYHKMHIDGLFLNIPMLVSVSVQVLPRGKYLSYKLFIYFSKLIHLL